jgi:uncharacterized protein (DUF305 family)
MTRIVRAIGVITLLFALTLAGTHSARTQDATPSTNEPMTATDVCNQVTQAATPVAESAEPPANATFDLAFIDLMMTHHQRSIDMATIALERGEHPELIEFAQQTIETSRDQLDRLMQWRELWFRGVPVVTGSQAMATFDQIAADSPGRGGVPGAREITTPVDIAALCGANPGEFDLAFIDRMVSLHTGALLLADAALVFAEHTEVQNFATARIASLQTDVDALNAWRLLWFPEATPTDVD